MFTKKMLIGMAALAALATGSTGVWAQTPPPAPAHHGLLGRLFHHPTQPATPGMTPMHHSLLPFHHTVTPGGGSATPIAGGVIGNKNTHVYHLPGDKSLPSPKNRVYFASAAAAQAAGYHASGSGHGAKATHKTHH